MKEITLKIPDNQLSFFMELVTQLGIEVAEEIEISEEHKDIVRERIKATKPKDMVPWNEARERFHFKNMT